MADEEDRQNRFLGTSGTDSSNGYRERAASQPPRSPDQGFLPSPTIPTSFGTSWTGSSRLLSQSSRSSQPIPTSTRSASMSNAHNNQFSSVMRDRHFPSTFEDDELEAFDTYDERYIPPSLASPTSRGRSYAQDISRSRSHSLATGRAPGSPSYLSSWNEGFISNPLNIPSSRYGEIKPPGSSRYGSLGALGSSPSAVNGYSSHNRHSDISNMSPFVRDVGQILLDDGSTFRELWAGVNPPRDENGSGGSGTTSRRHSVSVVQPRRGSTVVGFNAPDQDLGHDDYPLGRSGLMLSDEDLELDLNMSHMSMNDHPSSLSRHHSTASQPASLPNYTPTPTSRSPTSKEIFQPMNLKDDYDSPKGTPELTARFIPGYGIQYQPSRTPTYSSTARAIQNAYFSPQQRRPSDAQAPPPAPQENTQHLGKGLPLHSVSASWPLFIVEFKAGRTDLFYVTDMALAQEIRVGDLVIVEADRGKDLGKVVNDSITIEQVEVFQKQQMARAAGGSGSDEPGSPTSPTSTGKKEINPKMIYGKAQGQDAQLLLAKMQDEMKALQLCQSKVRSKKLPMEVVDAEYQWDRRKLTFYFVAEKRIDFRELVRELFRLYKTRIWMASLQGPDQQQ